MNRYLGIAASAAVLAICSAQAQVTCAIQNTTPATIRQEGIAELLSDIVLQCTGGTPTASGQPVPVVDVTLTFVYGFTNRLLGKNYTDALLTLDEPYPSTPVPAASIPANQPVQRLCYSTAAASPGSCNYLLGTGGGGYQTASDPYLQSNASTIYASAQLASYDEITWYGVPLDPPGPNGAVRYVRLTNLRTSANLIPISTQLTASVTISGTRFSIGNPQTSLGTIEPGLIAADTALPLCGCASHNASLVGGSGTPAFDATVQATEGSAGAFKRRNIGLTTDGTTPPAVYPQNIPGYPYNTETGFLPSPSIVSPPAYTLQPADSGTRLILVFSNVIQGMHIFLPVSVPLSGGTVEGAQLQLIQTQPNGFSGQAYTAIVSTAVIGTTPVAEASRTGETVFATYEVVDSDPAAIETATIPVAYAMSFGMGTALTGNIGVHTTFAPLSSMESAANDSEPVPRFASLSTFGINSPPTIAGDFDGNGVPDRVWVNDSTSQVTVHYAGYAGVDLQTFNWLSTSMMPTWHLVGVADFNGDGIPDLVWQDEVTREVLVNYCGVVPAAWYWLQSAPVPGWTVVAVVDFDGQGSPALVWQEDSTRRVTIHFYEGIEYQGWSWLQSTPVLGWHVVGMADFNRDGVPDLVWQSDTTGQVTVHYYGGPFGSVFQGWRWLNNAAAPPGWTVKAVSDVNGDGVPDLLWQNTTTHQVTVNYYGGPGGASLIGWNWISETGIPGWSIIH